MAKIKQDGVEKPTTPYGEHLFVWILGLMGIVLISCLAWLMLTAHEHGVTLQEVKSSTQSTDARVDRIAGALPALQIQIASEELGRPISGLLLAHKPSRDVHGNWGAELQVLDVDSMENTRYRIPLKGENDFGPVFEILGKVSYQQKFASLDEAAGWAKTERIYCVVPASYDPKASLVLPRDSVKGIMEIIPGKAYSVEPLKFESKPLNVRSLLETLSKDDPSSRPVGKTKPPDLP